MKKILILVLLAMSLLLPEVALSETTIKADNLQHDKQNDIYHLNGHVYIKKDSQTIRADRIDYYKKTETVKAEGNVYYEDEKVIIHSDKADINTRDRTGVLFNPELLFKDDNYRIKASKIVRVNEKEYILYDVKATTCNPPVPAWCFSSKKAKLKIGDTLRASNVTFRVKDIPVLYTPYMIAPVQTERKSGLLFPTIGANSKNGILWRQPFYLVISDNRDATFYLDLQGRKGLGEGIEYRYIERNLGEGNVWLYHIKDKEKGTHYIEFSSEHMLSKPKGLTGFLKINLINKKDFYKEFSHKVQAWSSRFLSSTGQIAYSNSNYQAYLDARFWQELRSEHQTGEVHQQLPEAGFYLYPRKIKSVYLSMKTALSSLYSVDSSRVYRFDIYPELRHSTGNIIRLSQTLGIRETAYWITNTDQYPDSQSRTSFDYNISLKTVFSKNYSIFRHIIEPELSYTFIPQINKDIPVIDPVDLYNRVSLINMRLNNYFYNKSTLVASIRLSQPYNFHQGDRPFQPLRLQLRLFNPIDLKTELTYSSGSGHIEKANVELSLNIMGAALSVSQRYSRPFEILYYTGSVSIPVTKRIGLTTTAWYDAKGEGINNYTIGVSYNSQCWGVKLTYDKKPGEYSFYLLIQLKGLGELNFASFI